MIHLETERLLFRDHEETDLEPYCEMESDPAYRFPQPVHPRFELERSFRETWLIPKAMGLLATILKSDKRYIGRCGLYPHRNEDDHIIPGEANIAFYLARPFWGQGFATEAGKAFIDFGFQSLGLSRIEAGINANNLASIRVVEKLGFVWVQSGKGGGSLWHLYELRNKAIQL
jgi:RimJ/RimL family protein N-acetyltransferase